MDETLLNHKETQFILLLEQTTSELSILENEIKTLGHKTERKILEDFIKNESDCKDVNLIIIDFFENQDQNDFEKVKKVCKNKEIPIIFYLNKFDKKIVANIKKFSKYGYILKDSNESILEATIEMTLELANMQETLKEERKPPTILAKNDYENENRYKKIFDTVKLGVIVYKVIDNGEDFIFVDFNKYAEVIDGKSYKELFGRSIYEVKLNLVEFGVDKVLKKIWQTGISEEFRINMTKSDNLVHCYENYAYKLSNDEIAVVFYDISETVMNENSLKKLLDNKETLFNEIHHRIKNNLNLITGIISLKISKSESKEIKDALIETKNRVLIMNEIYEKLYATKNQVDIYISEFITRIIEKIKISYTIKVETEYDIDSQIAVSSKSLYNLGLIINEIVTNSLKHAFDNVKFPKITIKIEKKSNLFIITIIDNGVGIKDESINNSDSGFGLMVIKGIVESYQGRLMITNENGTKFIIEIVL